MSVAAFEELTADLVQAGWLAPEQLSAAQLKASKEGRPLEDILKQMKLLLDSQLALLRARRLQIPYCDVSGFVPNLENARLVPEEVARRHVMFPLFVLDGLITLAMADPLDVAGIDQVRLRTRMEVESCVASPSDIMGLIERSYGAHRYLQSVGGGESGPQAVEAGDAAQPVIRLVDNLLKEAVHQKASDIHIEPGDHALRVRIRVDGVLRDVAAPPFPLHRAIVSRLKVMARLDIGQSRRPQDGSFHHAGGDCAVVVRVSILPTIFGEAAVLRLLRHESETISLAQLGLPAAMLKSFAAMIERPHGIILVSGPTGSGKTTTLYAAMHQIAKPHMNLIAIEDPVEYRSPVVRQVQVNAEAHLTFATGLRSILRQDPDVIMVGEIRDQETAQIAIQSALTGHLVLSTVHTNDAVGAVTRLREIGIAPYLLSSAILGVMAQRLCRRICPECRVPAPVNAELLQRVGLNPDALGATAMRGAGCRKCIGSGYSGRVGVFELFEVTEHFSEMIVRGESTESIRAAARAEGMRTLLDDGVDKVRQGHTTVDEVCRVAAVA